MACHDGMPNFGEISSVVALLIKEIYIYIPSLHIVILLAHVIFYMFAVVSLHTTPIKSSIFINCFTAVYKSCTTLMGVNY